MKLWGQSAKGRSNGSSVVSAEVGPTEHSSEVASELDNLLIEEVARRTRELLATRGWCLWRCRAFDDEVIVVAIDELVEGMPEGHVIYTDAELRELFGTDKPVSSATLRLVHEAKKRGAVITSTQWKD